MAWYTLSARNIYRRIGDRNKYLELRARHMEYGADYHDLATFYWAGIINISTRRFFARFSGVSWSATGL